MSPTSSRKIVPPDASSNRPFRSSTAPVKAPRLWPNSSDSSSVSGRAAQLTATKGRSARLPPWWIARAIISFPVPLSPRSSTVARDGATLVTAAKTSCIRLLCPTMFSIRYVFRIVFSKSLRCRLNSSCSRSIALCSLSACPMRQPITVRVRVSDSSARVPSRPIRSALSTPSVSAPILMGTQIQESGPSPDDFPCARVLSRNDGSTRTSGRAMGLPVFIVFPTIPSPQTYRARSRCSAV